MIEFTADHHLLRRLSSLARWPDTASQRPPKAIQLYKPSLAKTSMCLGM